MRKGCRVGIGGSLYLVQLKFVRFVFFCMGRFSRGLGLLVQR